MNQALELDPRNFTILQQISLTYQALRRYKEGRDLESVLAIAPKDIPSKVRRPGLIFYGGRIQNRYTRQSRRPSPKTQTRRLSSSA